MKTNLQKVFSVAAFCLIFGGAISCFAQIKTGGYKSIAVTDAAVIEAAEFAVETKSTEQDAEYTLEEIKSAETQTVAGTNYRLCLQVYIPGEDEDADGVTIYIKAVVFRNLKKEFSLKSWTEESCAGD